jgi:hypothetical protein
MKLMFYLKNSPYFGIKKIKNGITLSRKTDLKSVLTVHTVTFWKADNNERLKPLGFGLMMPSYAVTAPLVPLT